MRYVLKAGWFAKWRVYHAGALYVPRISTWGRTSTCECRFTEDCWRAIIKQATVNKETSILFNDNPFAQSLQLNRVGLLSTTNEWQILAEPILGSVISYHSIDPPWTVRVRVAGQLTAVARMGCGHVSLVVRRRYESWGPFFLLIVFRRIIAESSDFPDPS
jgi:hypothetical protein